jgi:phthiocerol/phenolphthiocerol synthesis type-I polyketide synthase E
MTDQVSNANAIAIIGMAGRFPGARNIDELWHLLKAGSHAITALSDGELEAAGVDPALVGNKHYVKRSVRLDDYDRFDAEFFGYSPRQATSLDPQGRVLLECAWEALEHAGYDPKAYDGLIGVFAGCSTNQYLQRYAQEIVEANSGSWHQTMLDGEKDFLTTRVSYKLGLKGPSVAVQTACSTSLVAVHLACQSLLTFESDMVLAGGVSVRLDQDQGYLHEEGGIASRDGYCRAYDADATGTIDGSGCGIVVLKRLEEALRDGDEIHALIRGTAVNNDGADKAGFSAPGVKAQVRLITSALQFAELQPGDIGMLEGHGTGTVLGDAVELTALSEAFESEKNTSRWCALGSIKSNFGHLDAAAGVAGLIKATLCLKHAHFVPSVHFAKPNPVLGSADSPFFVSTDYRPWPSEGKPRRAGVSAFGMGGTNAHVILEEATPRTAKKSIGTPQLFPLSAHTREALQKLCADLATYVEERPQLDLADVAYTLQAGRQRFAFRRVVVAASSEELVRALRSPLSESEVVQSQSSDRPVVFMFPGQGSQQAGAVRALYESDAFFHEQIDECATLFKAELGFDIRSFICHADVRDAALSIDSTLVTQPVVFTTGYCLAKWWMRWGITPSALLGHSVGEYVAACIAGVLTLQDCIKLVACRARLVNALPAGAMLAVRLPAGESGSLVANAPSISVAAINSPTQCVLSGTRDDIDEVARMAVASGVEHRRLQVSHAFHSSMMEEAMPGLEQAASQCSFQSPRLPYVSCVTGKQVRTSEVSEPAFWSRHLREPVNFQSALGSAVTAGSSVLLEVGSGQALANLARQQFGATMEHAHINSLSNGGASSRTELLYQLGKLWAAGASVDWAAFHADAPRRRTGLVGYPFQRQRYWIQPAPRQVATPTVTKRELASPVSDVPLVAPAAAATEAGWSVLEAHIAGLWREVLGVDAIGRADTFISLGGDSLIALRVIARINDEFGLKIPSSALISSTGTVEKVAAELAHQLTDGVDEAELGTYLASLGQSSGDSVQPEHAARNGWSGVEAGIAGLWQEVLGVESITRNDTFISLGGDSLIALRVTARLNEEFGVRIASGVLISPSGTVATLATELVRQLASGVGEAQLGEFLKNVDTATHGGASFAVD